MRMIDRIVEQGVFPLDPEVRNDPDAMRRLRDGVVEPLLDATVIEVSPVLDYFYRGEAQAITRIGDIPNAAPPFELFFMEGRFPILHEGDATWVPRESQMKPGTEVGVLFAASDLNDPDNRQRGMTFPKRADLIRMALLEGHAVRWLMVAQFYVRFHDGAIASPHRVEFLIDNEGALFHKSGVQYTLGYQTMLARSEREAAATGGQAGIVETEAIYPFLLAISFMHCRNVSLVERAPSRSEEKKYKRRVGRPMMRYHELNITPMRKVLRETEDAARAAGVEGANKRALHIVRGHFKNFRERGLFGKLKGMYWWGDMLRGSVDAGEVRKSYKVEVP